MFACFCSARNVVLIRFRFFLFFFFCRTQTNFWVNLMNVAFFYIWYSLSFYVSISFSAVYSVGQHDSTLYYHCTMFRNGKPLIVAVLNVPMFHCLQPPALTSTYCTLYTTPLLSAYLLSQRQTITSMLYICIMAILRIRCRTKLL